MKFPSFLALCAAGLTAAVAASVLDQVPLGDQEKYVSSSPDEQFLIELGPGNTKWVTEEEKWALKRVCILSRAASIP